MQRIQREEQVRCRVGYRGDFSAWLGDEPVVEARTVTLVLEPVGRDAGAPADDFDARQIGEISYGVFRPLSFPDQPIPFDLHVDLTSPLRKVWDVAERRPMPWVAARFSDLRSVFLVFASIEIDPGVGGRRIALAVMADLINRHLPPGGVALLNPYPLKYLEREARERVEATPEEKQRGVAELQRHYARLGLASVETEPDLMVLQRGSRPLRAPQCNLRFTRRKLAALPVFTDAGAEGLTTH